MIKNEIGVETNLQIIPKFDELNSKVLNLERELSKGKELQSKLQHDLETLGNSDSELNKKLDKFEETESTLAAIETINKSITREKEKLEKNLINVKLLLKLEGNETIESKIQQLLGQIQSKTDEIQSQKSLLKEKEQNIKTLTDNFGKEIEKYKQMIRRSQTQFQEDIFQLTNQKEQKLKEEIENLKKNQEEEYNSRILELKEQIFKSNSKLDRTQEKK